MSVLPPYKPEEFEEIGSSNNPEPNQKPDTQYHIENWIEFMPKVALRHNTGKAPMCYVFEFPAVMEAIGRVMEFGAAKYADGNWRIGGKPDKEYWDSMARHLAALKRGEVYDKDSGCSHLGHAIWNLMALLELNHPTEIINEEVFRKQCEYWLKKRAK